MTDQRGNASVEDVSSGQPGSVEDITPVGRSDMEGGAGGSGERSLGSEQAADRANEIDDATAGDGVQFFEGDPQTDAADVEGGA